MTKNPYDAVLYLSFGGPERPEDVMPFLRNVTRGRNVPEERLLSVRSHYDRFGGNSPINDLNRQVITSLEAELAGAGMELPVYFGNRNWHPLVEDTVSRMKKDGVSRALAFATSAYPGYSSCRQYVEDIDRAVNAAGGGIRVEKIRPFSNHPGFISALAEPLRQYLENSQPLRRRILFSAHSIPVSMARDCDYEAALAETAALVMSCAESALPYSLAYQSRSGPPSRPWLGPDILEEVARAAGEGIQELVVVPSGFVSEHIEVLYDLDVEAAELAAERNIGFVRLPTVGNAPAYVAMIRDLIEERVYPDRTASFLGSRGISCPVCPCEGCRLIRN